MKKENRWLPFSTLMLLLLSAASIKTCPVTVHNDTKYPCTVQNFEQDPSEIITVKSGEKIQFGQKGTHAHFRITQKFADDGTSVDRAIVLQQTHCGGDKSIIISVEALFAEQRNPELPFFDLFEIFPEEK